MSVTMTRRCITVRIRARIHVVQGMVNATGVNVRMIYATGVNVMTQSKKIDATAVVAKREADRQTVTALELMHRKARVTMTHGRRT